MTRRLSLALSLFVAALAAAACPAFSGESAVATEADRLVALLALEPGDAVADIGAGDGEMTIAVARKLGPPSRIWATELADELRGLRRAIGAAGVAGVEAVEALPDETNLPPGCCDAVYLRRVYHHFQRPERNAASLLRTVRPGGLVAVIDFEPREGWSAPEGTPENRGGHGMPSALLVKEMERAGFELVRIERDWPESMYAALFRRPE